MAQVLNFKSHQNETLVLNINGKQYTVKNSVCTVMDAIEASQADVTNGARKALEILLGKKEVAEIIKSDMTMDEFLNLTSKVLVFATTGKTEGLDDIDTSFREGE